ncbi:putative uncharacterized protein DDB_G0279653 [Folsomia candida]|nr:putative uncharacterized protein DDB_G0279653 [Folsomia candida]
MLNSMLDQEARVEQARKQHQYYIQSGVSEDSDYTSDVNYPIGQHPNSSASQFLSAANQLTTPQRSLNSSRENSYEKDDDYYHRTANGSNQQQQGPYYHPQYPQSHGRKQLPTIPSQQNVPGNRNPSRRGYWEEPRDAETDQPLYYNSRPQSNYKSYGRYRRRGSWEDEFNQKRPEYASQQYNEDYDNAQDYSQPSHNYAKRLKNNRRTNSSLERQYTLYDGTGDYAADEESHEVNSKAISYDEPSSYSSYAQPDKNSVYNDYNQDYSEYSTELNYNDGYTDNKISAYDPYTKDTSYGYDVGGDTRDHYSASSKSIKELPTQISSHYNEKSQLSSQAPSPYTSQSTVKEMSIAPNTVQSSVSNIPQEYPSSNFIINSGDYGNAEDSFYDASSNYNNHVHVDHLTTSGGTNTITNVATTIATNENNDPSEQYMDAYDKQTGYEDWENYGYYDEAGNYIEYDQNSAYYSEEPGSSTQPAHTQVQQASDITEEPYSLYYDHNQDSSVTQYDTQYDQTVPSTATSVAPAAVTTTTTKVTIHQEPSNYNKQYDSNFYQSSAVVGDDKNQDYDDQPIIQEEYGTYDQDGYWYDATEDANYPIAQAEHGLPDVAPLSSKGPSNDEYNYAYQSAENLTSYEPSVHPKLDHAESVSRRASFRRQASTRSDYTPHDGTPTSASQPFIKDANHVPTAAPHAVPTTSAPPTTTATATAAAAVVASKFASEMKSALPQLSSLTKGKSDLFSSGFSKLGNFVSNAAAKSGVSVPLMNQNKDVNKESQKILPSQPTAIQPAQQVPEISVDQGFGYPFDDQQQYQQYDNWEEHPYNDENYNQYQDNTNQNNEEGYEYYEGVEGEGDFNKQGPVHMDSLESNPSEGARDAEDLEAEYWQKQQERIAKQSALQTQESHDIYPKSNVLQSMDSTDDKGFLFSQNSLDTEEFLERLEQQSGGQARPMLSKKDTMSMSLDRSESIDQQTDYGDEYDRQDRQGSLESGEGGYPMSPPPHPMISEEDEIIEDGHRKSSLEIHGKEKGSKSVSFEEEPPKAVPERQTKGMKPREKWLWAINRICAKLAVRT